MSEKDDARVALNRMMEKLTAFRQTLTSEERLLLDDIVANSTFDVSAHGLAVERSASRSQSKYARKTFDQAAVDMAQADAAVIDVQAHAAAASERFNSAFTPDYGYQVSKTTEGRAAESGRTADSALAGDTGIM